MFIATENIYNNIMYGKFKIIDILKNVKLGAD